MAIVLRGNRIELVEQNITLMGSFNWPQVRIQFKSVLHEFI